MFRPLQQLLSYFPCNKASVHLSLSSMLSPNPSSQTVTFSIVTFFFIAFKLICLSLKHRHFSIPPDFMTLPWFHITFSWFLDLSRSFQAPTFCVYCYCLLECQFSLLNIWNLPLGFTSVLVCSLQPVITVLDCVDLPVLRVLLIYTYVMWLLIKYKAWCHIRT